MITHTYPCKCYLSSF